jgi:hypothetical protein
LGFIHNKLRTRREKLAPPQAWQDADPINFRARNEMVRRLGLPIPCALALTSLVCSAQTAPPSDKPTATSVKKAPPVRTVGVWQPAPGQIQLPIWPGSPPDGTLMPQPPESVNTYQEPPEFGGKSEAVLDIAIPTMTIIRPKGRSNGTAVIVFPGGGFQMVFVTLEGTEICDWLIIRGDHLHRVEISRARRQRLLGRRAQASHHAQDHARVTGRPADDPAGSFKGERVEHRSQQDRRDGLFSGRLSGRADQ